MKKKYWIGDVSDGCDVCGRPFFKMMFDCSLSPGHPHGMWGCICRNCFLERGCRLGTGYGQEYQKQEDGRWLKIRG